MTIRLDPENNETAVLIGAVGSFAGLRILEIGCGEGRQTFRYATEAAKVIAIDPNAEKIERARQATPPEMARRVDFQVANLEDFYAAWRSQPRRRRFDLILLSWSL